MTQSTWDDLGAMSPDHYDPSGIDPYHMTDLKDPTQAAGPVPMNGQHPPGMHPQMVAPPPGVPQNAPSRGMAAPPDPSHWDNSGMAAIEGTGMGYIGAEANGDEQSWAAQVPWEQVAATVGQAGQTAADIYTQQRQLEMLNHARAQQGQPPVQMPVVRRPGVPGAASLYGMDKGSIALLVVGAAVATGFGTWWYLKKRRR